MEDATALDATYGRHMKTAREERGLTQADIVRELRDRGVTYMNASTLSRIEAGTRPLRLSEADAFARIFKFRLTTLTRGHDGFVHFEHARAKEREMTRKYAEFREMVAELAEYQAEIPALIRGLDIFLARAAADDEDLKHDFELLKRNMLRSADRDLVADVKAAQRRVAKDVERAVEGRDGGSDGQH